MVARNKIRVRRRGVEVEREDSRTSEGGGVRDDRVVRAHHSIHCSLKATGQGRLLVAIYGSEKSAEPSEECEVRCIGVVRVVRQLDGRTRTERAGSVRVSDCERREGREGQLSVRGRAGGDE